MGNIFTGRKGKTGLLPCGKKISGVFLLFLPFFLTAYSPPRLAGQEDRHILIEQTDPFMQLPGVTYYPKGQVIPRLVGDHSSEELADVSFSKKNVNLCTVEEENGVLQVDLVINDIKSLKDSYDCLAIEFSINCKYNIEGENTPQWIKDYHLPDYVSKDSDQVFRKTFGLLDFYEILVGNKRGQDGRIAARQERTISDAVVTLMLNEQ